MTMIKIYLKVPAIFLASLFVLATAAWYVKLRARQFGRREISAGLNSTQAPLCKNNIDIRINIARLASNSPDTRQAVGTLLLLGEDPECRKEIIRELLRAMNEQNPNVETDRSSYFLWSNGAAILGDLKAVEALDLLIEHLDLNDGFFSASMAHQPLVLGLEKMGIVAVPKLGIALQHHMSRDIRLSAALCLADIGGTEAMDALKKALDTETDQCVRRFITLSLPRPAGGLTTKERLASDDGEVLRQRLLAFRCGN
jgi:HEAT repeat protein